MPSYVTPKINTEYIFYVSLVSQANPNILQVNPTLATGDVKVSTDGGAEGNVGTLSAVTPSGSKRVKVTLSASEMNGDNIQVTFSDAAGSEWVDLTINIQTTTNQIDELVGAVWDEVLTGATHNIQNSSGKILRQLRGAFIEDGTAQAGGAITITLETIASDVDDFYDHAVVVITAGTGQGGYGLIDSYIGSTRVATMHTNWVIQPDDTSEYAIIAYGKTHALELDSFEPGAITQITNAVWASALALAEQAAGAPPKNPTPQQVMMYEYMHLRNKGVSDSNTGKFKIYNDADAVIAEGTLDDTSGVFTKGKLGDPS